ncbi:hypothetical protein [Auritidibacter sp. NML100628]|nr:hypothetical protein [Auritidibacter sp. NML100628]
MRLSGPPDIWFSDDEPPCHEKPEPDPDYWRDLAYEEKQHND